MKKLLAMLGATGLVVSTGAILVSCNEKEAPKAEATELPIRAGEVKFDEAAEVSSIVMTVAKAAKAEAPEPSVKGITLKDGYTLDAETNTTLTGTLLIADGVEPGDYIATFTANRKEKDAAIKEGEVEPLSTTYDFKVEAKEVALSTVITETVLGELATKDADSIKAAVIEKNPEALALTLTVKPEFTDTTATITAEGYTGEVEVTYTIKEGTPDPETALSTVITVPGLGELTTKDEASIIAAVKKANPAAEKLELTVKPEFTDTTATITAEGYTGEVEVTYTIKAKEVALSTVITVPGLGELTTKDEASIIAAVKKANPAAEKLELTVKPEFTDTTATITAEGYTGEVEVTYTIKATEG